MLVAKRSHTYVTLKTMITNVNSKQRAITASIAQLGERKTEDLEALCSIHSRGITFILFFLRTKGLAVLYNLISLLHAAAGGFCCSSDLLPEI